MPTHTLVIAAAALIGLAVVAAALLHGWKSWLAQRGREIELHQRREAVSDPRLVACSHSLARIEMADLRERVRKLEAIAAGVDV